MEIRKHEPKMPISMLNSDEKEYRKNIDRAMILLMAMVENEAIEKEVRDYEAIIKRIQSG